MVISVSAPPLNQNYKRLTNRCLKSNEEVLIRNLRNHKSLTSHVTPALEASVLTWVCVFISGLSMGMWIRCHRSREIPFWWQKLKKELVIQTQGIFIFTLFSRKNSVVLENLFPNNSMNFKFLLFSSSTISSDPEQPAAKVTESKSLVSGSNPLSFKCEDCSRRFTSSLGLKLHSKIHQNSEIRMIKKCPKCGKACRTNWHLQKHMKSHRKFPSKLRPFSFKCPFCVMEFPFQSKLIAHCQAFHDSERLKSETFGGVQDTKSSPRNTDLNSR